MSGSYFKYKALSLTPKGELDDRSTRTVVNPIVQSYYYLPTREKLNDPNEGVYKDQIQSGVAAFLQGVMGLGERNELSKSLYDLASKIVQSTDSSGVFSLSKTVTDELMWAHYGASHFGLAIEYSLDQLTRFSSTQHLHCFDMEYVKEPPSLDMHRLQGRTHEVVRTMLGHKSPRWLYEEEFRIVLDNINGPLPHDYRAVKSITFGLKVPEHIRTIIFDATKHKVPEYYEICKIAGTYLLERKLLEDMSGESPKGETFFIDWSKHLQGISVHEKNRIVGLFQSEIDNDPHFEGLILAEKSSIHPCKAVLHYQAKHHLELQPCSKYTKRYYEL